MSAAASLAPALVPEGRATQSKLPVPYAHIDVQALAADIRALREELRRDVGPADLAHLRRLARWGRVCTTLGYATGWIAPNPLSALLLAEGNFARWALVTHPVSHRAYDRIPSAPEHLTSRRFAKGWRRVVDWLDWITPEAWHEEHDLIHHFHLTEVDDPDHVEINLEWLRKSKLPMPLRYAVVAMFACIWKPAYYAPNTLKELRSAVARRSGGNGHAPSLLGWREWTPLTQQGRDLWAKSYLPYGCLKFLAVPALFAPFGAVAAANVLLNSLAGEALANLHAFLMIIPSHTGEDMPHFEEPVQDKADFYVRQIIGTVNYKTGTPLVDFLHGYLNYHIEHHLFPDLPLRQYELAQARLKEICKKHGVPYREESVWRRLRMAVDVMVGKASLQPIATVPLAR